MYTSENVPPCFSWRESKTSPSANDVPNTLALILLWSYNIKFPTGSTKVDV